MNKHKVYSPPYVITPAILRAVAEIGELLGRYSATTASSFPPKLRRANRIRTVHASLAIENNTLTLEQVTAVLSGKRVLGLPREIQEVRNAFAAYERLDGWDPTSEKDLMEAHGIMLAGLVDEPGAFRSKGVGIFRGKHVVHMAPPAKRVKNLMHNLLDWLKNTEEHPLVASSVFHYEFEFIHPFADGNGRLGRLWQTLILSKWKPVFSCLPVETVICANQEEYYKALEQADKSADISSFIEFMLKSLHTAVAEAVASDQVAIQVSDQVTKLLMVLKGGAAGAGELMKKIGLSHRPTFRKNYLEPALREGFIERTQPDSPQSPTQRYRLTDKGRSIAQEIR